jgi:iron(III) transport system ATP-binding protein
MTTVQDTMEGVGLGAEDTSPAISVTDLVKSFTRHDGAVVPAIDDTTLEVARGEFLVLLGASGCGKSTFLRCLAGLEEPDTGQIVGPDKRWFSSEDDLFVPPERRDASMVFQSYALWPHMTVFGNVAYPWTTGGRRHSKSQIRDRVTEVLELVGIAGLADQYPGQVSGGQQQRVALARALVQGSDVVLFDEPLSNVDARVRVQLRTEIRAMQQRLGFTAVYVTHDQEEAFDIADRIAVIDHGKVAHVGTPREVFHEPANLRVARFVGRLEEQEGKVCSVDGASVTVSTPIGDVVAATCEDGLAVGDDAVVVWRPGSAVIDGAEASVNSWSGKVTRSHLLGTFTDTEIGLGAQHSTHTRVWEFGDRVRAAETTCRVVVPPEKVRALRPME